MPTKTYVIEWDFPDEDFWLTPDSVEAALSVYCKNTRFKVSEAVEQQHSAYSKVCTCRKPISTTSTQNLCGNCGNPRAAVTIKRISKG